MWISVWISMVLCTFMELYKLLLLKLVSISPKFLVESRQLGTHRNQNKGALQAAHEAVAAVVLIQVVALVAAV